MNISMGKNMTLLHYPNMIVVKHNAINNSKPVFLYLYKTLIVAVAESTNMRHKKKNAVSNVWCHHTALKTSNKCICGVCFLGLATNKSVKNIFYSKYVL